MDGRFMAGLASRIAPERDVLRGEALRVMAAVRGARWCRWSAMPGRCWCRGCRRSAAAAASPFHLWRWIPMTGTFPPGGLVSPPLGTAVAGTDVACGGCCAY